MLITEIQDIRILRCKTLPGSRVCGRGGGGGCVRASACACVRALRMRAGMCACLPFPVHFSDGLRLQTCVATAAGGLRAVASKLGAEGTASRVTSRWEHLWLTTRVCSRFQSPDSQAAARRRLGYVSA